LDELGRRWFASLPPAQAAQVLGGAGLRADAADRAAVWREHSATLLSAL
jgi:hypothetical protein